jgi:hypothetical protein
MPDHQISQRPGRNERQLVAELLDERRRIVARHVGEDKAAPLRDCDPVQPELRAIKTADPAHRPGGAQPPVQIVGPLVVGAHKQWPLQCPGFARAQGRSAMTAGIEVALKHAVLVTHQEQVLVGYSEGTERLSRRQSV